MNVQFRCSEPFLPGYFDRIYVIFRILITFFFYPVNPVDPVKVLRSISNNAANQFLDRVQVVPVTTSVGKLYPSETYIAFQGKPC